MRRHDYTTTVRWTGDRGTGTATYRGYGRDHTVQAAGRPTIEGSSDPAFRGDGDRWNPELLFVAALSECHMLVYLHLCASAGIVVTNYQDDAAGVMEETADGGGSFVEVVLRPVVTITDPTLVERATQLHHDANRLCFLANSVRIPVKHEPTVRASGAGLDQGGGEAGQ